MVLNIIHIIFSFVPNNVLYVSPGHIYFASKFDNNVFTFNPPINAMNNQITLNIGSAYAGDYFATLMGPGHYYPMPVIIKDDTLPPIWYDATIEYSNPMKLNILNPMGFQRNEYILIRNFTTTNPEADYKIINQITSSNGLHILRTIGNGYYQTDIIIVDYDGTSIPNQISNLIVKFIYTNDLVTFNIEIVTLKNFVDDE